MEDIDLLNPPAVMLVPEHYTERIRDFRERIESQERMRDMSRYLVAYHQQLKKNRSKQKHEDLGDRLDISKVAEIATLRDQLKLSGDEISELKRIEEANRKAHATKVALLRDKVAVVTTERNAVKQKLEATTTHEAPKNLGPEEFRQKMKSIEKRIGESSLAKETAEQHYAGKMASLQKAIDTITAQHDGIESKLEAILQQASRSTGTSALQKDVEALQNEVNERILQVDAQAKETMNVKASLETERVAHMTKCEERDGNPVEIENLQLQLQSLRAEVAEHKDRHDRETTAKLSETVQTLEREKADHVSTRSALDEKTAKLDHVQNQLETTETALDRKSTSLARELLLEKERSERTWRQYEVENGAHEMTRVALQKRTAETEDLQRQLKSAEETKQRKKSLEVELVGCEKACEEAQTQLAQANRQIREGKAKVTQLKDEVDNLRDELRKAQEHSDRLNREAKDNHRDSLGELRNTEEKHAELEAALCQSRKELQIERAKFEEAAADIKDLMDAKSEAQRHSADYQAALEDTRARNLEQQLQYESLEQFLVEAPSMIQWPDINIREVNPYDAINYLRALAAELMRARQWALCVEGQHCNKVVEEDGREVAISTLPEAQRGSALWILQQNLALANKVIKSQRVEITSLKRWKDNPQNRQCLAAEIKKLQRDLNLEREKKTTENASVHAEEAPWPRCSRYDPPEDINGVKKQPCCCPDCIDFTQRMSRGLHSEAEGFFVKEQRLQELNMLALRDADAERQRFVSDLQALEEQKAALSDSLHDSGRNTPDTERYTKEENNDQVQPVTENHRFSLHEERMHLPSTLDSEAPLDGSNSDEDDSEGDSDAISDSDSESDSDDDMIIIMDNLREYNPNDAAKDPHIAGISRQWARDLETPGRAQAVRFTPPLSEEAALVPQFSPIRLNIAKLPQTEGNSHLSWTDKVQAKVNQQYENEARSATSEFLDMNLPPANTKEVDDLAIDVRRLSPTAESFVPSSAFGGMALSTKQTTKDVKHQENRPRVCLPIYDKTSKIISAGKEVCAPAKVGVPVATLSPKVAGSGLGGSMYVAIGDADLEPRSRAVSPLEAAALNTKVGLTRPTPTVALPRHTDQATTSRPQYKPTAMKDPLSLKSGDMHVDSGYTTTDEGANVEKQKHSSPTAEHTTFASTPAAVSSDVSVVAISETARKTLATKNSVTIGAPLLAAAKQAQDVLRHTPTTAQEPQAAQRALGRTFPPPKSGGLGSSRYATAQDFRNEAAKMSACSEHFDGNASKPPLRDPPPTLCCPLEHCGPRGLTDRRRNAAGTNTGFTNSSRRNQNNNYQGNHRSQPRGQGHANGPRKGNAGPKPRGQDGMVGLPRTD